MKLLLNEHDRDKRPWLCKGKLCFSNLLQFFEWLNKITDKEGLNDIYLGFP